MALRKVEDRVPARVEPTNEGAVARLVQVLLDAGIDGLGPLKSAQEMAEAARLSSRSGDAAVAKVARNHVGKGAVGGFVTGIGGFLTMPIALPANVLEFYIVATRMVASIADLRGYEVDDPQVRTAVLLTLVGSDADEVLKKAGLTGGTTGKVLGLAAGQLPPAGLLMLNKAIGFRILRGVGEKAFSRLGRGVPLAGGVLGGGVDMWMMKRIADHAMNEFPSKDVPSGVSRHGTPQRD
jgi:EcsC protein family